MRRFQNADRETAFLLPPSIQDWLPENHLARFIVDVVAELNLRPLYDSYGGRGSAAVDPGMLLALLFYGYATGTFSSRKLEKASYESVPVRYICANTHPDHDTIANFRKRFLKEIGAYFVEILVIAKDLNFLNLGNVSIDGSKIKACASKHSAVSYARAGELEQRLTEEVRELLEMAEKADAQETTTLDIPAEIALREKRIARIREARRTIGKRAELRDEINQAKDQYNFTDPESAIMKSGSTGAFEQDYNCQIAVEQNSMLIVSCNLSNHPNDQRELLPVLDGIPAMLGKPDAVAADTGYFSKTNIDGCQARGIEPFLSPGRQPHYLTLEKLQEIPQRLCDIEVSGFNPSAAMEAKLKTAEGRTIFGRRKSTVEPVIGIIKHVLGFRQFSLRGLANAGGEWLIVCSAFNLKRMFRLRSCLAG